MWKKREWCGSESESESLKFGRLRSPARLNIQVDHFWNPEDSAWTLRQNLDFYVTKLVIQNKSSVRTLLSITSKANCKSTRPKELNFECFNFMLHTGSIRVWHYVQTYVTTSAMCLHLLAIKSFIQVAVQFFVLWANLLCALRSFVSRI